MNTDLITTYESPFRVRVIEGLESALEEINTANGYPVDLTDAVLWGRTRYDEADPLPMVSLLEPPVPPDWDKAMMTKVYGAGDWPLLVQGFVPDDYEKPTAAAYALAAAVKRRLAIEKFTDNASNIFGMGPKTRRDGNHVLDLFIGSEVVRPADEQSAKAFFWLPLSLKIVENHLQPYA